MGEDLKDLAEQYRKTRIEEPYKVGFYLDKKVYMAFKDLCEKEGITMSAAVHLWMVEQMEKHGKKGKK